MSDLVEQVAIAISGAPFATEKSRKKARAVISLVRKSTLEEAAKVAEAEKMEGVKPPTLSLEQITAIEAATKITGKSIAKKIRKLGEE